MSFAFGFSGDDIDGHDNINNSTRQVEELLLGEKANPQEAVKVQKMSLKEMLSSLPSRISYTSTILRSPKHGKRAIIPRRALFDIRLQLMAEEEEGRDSTGAADASAGLGESDIEQNVYEGGFKSWEGATDLSLLLSDQFAEEESAGAPERRHVIELGCGTALPSLIALQHCLMQGIPLRLTLADYNASVLRLVTLPNLLLLWASRRYTDALSPGPPTEESLDGELEISPKLLEDFNDCLSSENYDISLVAGPWCAELAQEISIRKEDEVLVLAAETIYSPTSTRAFTEAVLELLRQAKSGRALVAAKRVYFGVGGGVANFESEVSRLEGDMQTLSGTGIEGADPDVKDTGGGVARWLGEINVKR